MQKRAPYSGNSGHPQVRKSGRPPVKRPAHAPRRRGVGAGTRLPQNRRPVPKRRKARLKRHLTLHIFEAIGGVFSGLANVYKNAKKTRRFRELTLIATFVLIIVAGIWAIGVTTRPNAFDVQLNGESLGVVRWQGYEMEAGYFETHVHHRLQSRFGTDVFLNAEIIATPTRAGSNTETITFSTMITAIINSIDFYINAAKINVDGTYVVTLANSTQAQSLIDDIKIGYAGHNHHSYVFEQDIVITTQRVNNSDVHTAAQAYEILTTPRYLREMHVVGPGDTLYTIAQHYGMTLSGLLALNPNVNPEGILSQGTPLLVTPNTSILTVRHIGGTE